MAAAVEREPGHANRAEFERTLAQFGVAVEPSSIETQSTPSSKRLFDAALANQEKPGYVAMWAVHMFYWRKGIAVARVQTPAPNVIEAIAASTAFSVSPLIFMDALLEGAERGYYEDSDATFRYVSSLLEKLSANNWFIDTVPWSRHVNVDDAAKLIIRVCSRSSSIMNVDPVAVVFACLFELQDASYVPSLPLALHALAAYMERVSEKSEREIRTLLVDRPPVSEYLLRATPDLGHDEYDTAARFVHVLCDIADTIPNNQRFMVSNLMAFLHAAFGGGKDVTIDARLSKQMRGGGSGAEKLAPIVALVSRLQAELIKCRMNAMTANDAFTYRRTKVSILAHIRRSVENAMRYRITSATDPKAVDVKCVQLHNSPRHIFTMTTWKEVFPAVENFIRADDPTKRACQPLVQARMQFYALMELGHMLDVASAHCKTLLQTLQDAANDAARSAKSISTAFKHLDGLIWLQQKTWREHAFDDFYSQSEMDKHGYNTVPWCIQNQNLFAHVNRIDEYSSFLSALLQERTTDYDEKVEAAIVAADVNFPYNNDALDIAVSHPDLFNPCASTNSGRSARLMQPNKSRYGFAAFDDEQQHGSKRAVNKPKKPDIIDDLFDDILGTGSSAADEAFLTSFLDEVDQRNSSLVQGGEDQHQRGGGDGKNRFSDTEVRSKMPSMQRKVSMMVDDVKKTLMECTSTIDMIMMTSTSADGTQQWKRLQYNLQRVGDVFYHRIRLGPNHYFRGFGAEAKLAVGSPTPLEGAFEKKTYVPSATKSVWEMVMLSLSEIDTILIFVLKFSRVATLLLSMYAAQHVFLERYIHDVYAAENPPPNLFNIMLFALSIDACLQLVLITIIVIASVMNKTPKNSFVFDDVFLTMLLKEYILSTVLMIVLGSIIAWIMSKKRYFAYRTDGIRVIKAYNAILLGVLIAVALIPCFKLLA